MSVVDRGGGLPIVQVMLLATFRAGRSGQALQRNVAPASELQQ